MHKILVSFIGLLIILSLISCTKEDRRDVKESIDSASHTLGRDADTIVNKIMNRDSLFDNADVQVMDTSKLRSKEFRSYLNDIFDKYSDIKGELEDDDSSSVVKQSEEFRQVLLKTQNSASPLDIEKEWKMWLSTIEKINGELAKTKTLSSQRKLFSDMSISMENLITKFGLEDRTVYKLGCSSLNSSITWLTDSKDTDNPYYGKDVANGRDESCIKILKAWKFN